MKRIIILIIISAFFGFHIVNSVKNASVNYQLRIEAALNEVK